MDIPVDPESLPHDNRAYVLIVVVVVVLSIASLSVGLRIYTRASLLKQVGPDDYLAVAALALAFATGISECVNTSHGLGKHAWDLVPPGEIIAYFKNFYVSIFFYNTGLLVVKLTFLTQYYRVLVLKRFRTICVVAMLVVGAWGLSQVLVGLFICTPVAGFWDSSIEAKCVPTPLQWYINAAGNITSDVVIFVLPLPVLAHLSLPLAQRLSLVGIFSLGFFTCAISVIRIKFLKQGGDFSYENVEASVWSITELCSGVICVSLPTLRPFVSKYVPKLASRLQNSSAGYQRTSDSQGTAIAKGSKHTHTRDASKESNGATLGSSSQDGLSPHHPDSELRTSSDTSDGIIGLRSTKKALAAAEDSSRVSPLSLNPTRTPSQSRNRPDTVLGWQRPAGVMTTVSIGNNREPRASSREQPSTIHVTHDIMMRQLTPPTKI